jgi:hypothetical protein
MTAQQMAAKNLRAKRYYRNDAESYRVRNARRYREQKDAVLATNRNCRYIREYGISTEDYDAMFKEQNGLCAICYQPETHTCNGKVNRLSIDHDHATTEIRGLLCSRCNAAVGYLRDDPQIASSLVAYLLRYPRGGV